MQQTSEVRLPLPKEVAGQIYSIVNSEDKQKIMVFKLNGSPTTGTIVSTALFDKPSSPRFRIASVIRSKLFLSGQCIDSRGELNTDTRFKEDHALEGQREGYTYYRRFGESVDKGEMIFPCQKGREVYLVSLRF